jgi:hypothetical protein
LYDEDNAGNLVSTIGWWNFDKIGEVTDLFHLPDSQFDRIG